MGAEKFILRDGYMGPFIAIYGQPDGVKPSFKGDTAVYNVPSSGILQISLVEPKPGTDVSLVYSSNPSNPIGSFSSCRDLEEYARDAQPRVCWLDYSVLGSGIPTHIVGVVTDWETIEKHFDRTAALHDSLVLRGGGGKAQKWRDWRKTVKVQPSSQS